MKSRSHATGRQLQLANKLKTQAESRIKWQWILFQPQSCIFHCYHVITFFLRDVDLVGAIIEFNFILCTFYTVQLSEMTILESKFFNILFLLGTILLHVLVFYKHGANASAGYRYIAGRESTSSKSTSECPFKIAKAYMGIKSAFVTNPAATKSTSQSRSSLKSVTPSKFRNLNSLQFVRDHKITSSSTLYSSKMVQPEVLQTVVNEIAQAEKAPKKKKKTTEALEVLVLGLSHHNAKVEVREKLAIPEDKWNDAAAELCEYDSISEVAVLSTCNRFELYISGTNQYECMRDAIDYLYKRAGETLSQEVLRRNLFMLSGEDAIWHLLRVSAGLDSLVVGEGQILSQVKKAYEHGIESNGHAGKVLSRMLNVAVSAGKRVRTETGISKGAVSISSAAAEFTAFKLNNDCGIDKMEDAKITIIGAGKMARLLLVHLQTQGVTQITIVNRSKERMIELQNEFPNIKIDMRLMDEMWNVIRNSDVVYPSTAATTTIIDPAPLTECLASGRTRPGGLQFVDISVPRNVHADCGEVRGVFSYNVDDLKAVVERNTAKRRREMIEAESILREELGKFRLWQQSLGAIPTIAKLQEKAEALRMEELQKVSKKLSGLSAKDQEIVERVTKGIVAKLLHGPMNHLRQQSEGDATRAAILQLQRAFQLEQ